MWMYRGTDEVAYVSKEQVALMEADGWSTVKPEEEILKSGDADDDDDDDDDDEKDADKKTPAVKTKKLGKIKK